MVLAHVEAPPILMACRRTKYLRDGAHAVGWVRQIYLEKAMALTRGLLAAGKEEPDQSVIPKPVKDKRTGRGSCMPSAVLLNNAQLPPATPDCVWEPRNQELAPLPMREIAIHGPLLGSGSAPAWGAQPGPVAQANLQELPAEGFAFPGNGDSNRLDHNRREPMVWLTEDPKCFLQMPVSVQGSYNKNFSELKPWELATGASGSPLRWVFLGNGYSGGDNRWGSNGLRNGPANQSCLVGIGHP
jgi:hypothetical protein